MAIYDRINKPLTGDAGAAQGQLSRVWPQVQAYLQTLSPQQRDLLTNEAYGNVQIHRLRDLVKTKFGVTIPDGYHVKLDGTLHDNTSVGSFLAESALPAVAPFVAGALLPAIAGGSTVAGAGSGVTAGGAGAGTVLPTVAGVGGTAATVAPVSTAYSWLSPLLRTGLPVAGGIINSVLQNNANRDASRLEQEGLDKALAAEKEKQDYERARDKEQTGYERTRDEERQTYGRSQYANYLGRLDPYAQAGPPAVSRLTDVLGRPGAIPQVGNGAMITLRSPDGQTQQVPQEHADWYLSRGATRV